MSGACPWCSAAVPTGAPACPDCGARLVEDEATIGIPGVTTVRQRPDASRRRSGLARILFGGRGDRDADRRA